MSKKHKKHHKSDKGEKSSGDGDKPLKLVLKVGGVPADAPTESIIPEHQDVKKHKHKKKKKKHKHEKHEREREERKEKEAAEDVEMKQEVKEEKTTELVPTVVAESEKKTSKKEKKKRNREAAGLDTSLSSQDAPTPPPSKKSLFVEEPSSELIATPVRGVREHKETDNIPLHNCLDYLHKILSRKDVNGFFAFPVTDSIAPGYTSIISEPMDFSTMKTKIDSGDYNNVQEYKKDFKLMCDNCMTYNRPETIFYKDAKRLWSIASKQMTKEKLISLKKNLPSMNGLTMQDLGMEQEEEVNIESVEGPDVAAQLRKTQPIVVEDEEVEKPQLSVPEVITDDLTPEEILQQAQAAAKYAQHRLSLRQPDSKIGFLKRREDGTTTLNILNPDNDGIVSETERVVTLGSLAGKLTSGAGNIAGFREDKRNKATPASYLEYGPFSSYAPSYDSSFANLSKEDTDLLLATYGDETAMHYAKSLCNFVADSGDFAVRAVDSLLDILTNGEHSKSNAILEEKRKAEEEKKKAEEEAEAARVKEEPVDVNVDQLRSLSDIGIDVSFLDSFAANKPVEVKNEIDEKLGETSSLLQDLQKTQYERLSAKPPQHLAHVAKPSTKEIQLADKVTKGLTELAKQATPGDICSTASVRGAMGVTMTTMQDDSPQPPPEVSTTSQVSQSAAAMSSSASPLPEPASSS